MIRVADDAELLAVESAAQLNDGNWRDDTGLFPCIRANPQLHQDLHLLELIDSVGRGFMMRVNDIGQIEYQPIDQCYRISEIVELVQQHAAVQGHCCVAKIGAKTIQQAIQLVEHLNRE